MQKNQIINKGFIMNRAIKFKLKNGKVVTIRRIYGTDYDAVMAYLNKFSRGSGAKWTWHYSGQPKKDKEKAIKTYENPNNLFIGALDEDKIIGLAMIFKEKPDHPYSGRVASTGLSILEQYTSNGLGTKFNKILEKWARENNVHVLQSGVRHKNIRALGNLLKQGYEIVGVLHDTAFIDGEWYHTYMLEKILEK